ncbi:lipoprotein [Alcanivorax hongdengensis A-11-3]|uniref:Lipoprotein n=1 Tax=Alcanivorax hongdengensis A-11-3 TaxID=1177179 RepID=L0WEP1_9GAMM|nr:lipoprotein [Alcanivorax hongdengensis A-11-3]
MITAVAVLAGCSSTPTSHNTPYAEPSKPAATQAPNALSAARTQLNDLQGQARITTTLHWASHYLEAGRAKDASQLLDTLSQTSLQSQSLFDWLLLSGRALLAQQQPQPALDLLDQHQQQTQNLPADQQARLDLLRADALAMNGDTLSSLQQRVAAHPLLDKDDQQYNHRMIWQLLMQMPNTKLAEAIDGSSGDLRGWLTLAQLYRDPVADLDAQVQRLNQWSAQWRTHPAISDVPAMMDALRQAAKHRPSQVAVLLPLSGSLGNAGQALQEGMMTAYTLRQQKGGTTPVLRFYDSNTDEILALYQRAIGDGADFVLGPLAKDKAAVLASQGTLPVTTLALNYIDMDAVPDNFFQFGLAPEDEARQVARQGAREGHTQAGILYPEGDWGERVGEAFAQQWQSQGGTVTVTRAYGDGADIGETVKDMLLVAQSDARGREISRFTNLKVDAEPRRRQDMGFLFLVANPDQGRQVKPALNFHYAKDLPVYSTALIYSGEPNPRRDHDLDGVRFVDMPWILGDHDSELHQAADTQWPDGHARYERLFAMGIDAYRLQGRLYLLSTLPTSELPGATGRLTMDNHRIVRHLNWAIFVNGEARALPQVAQQPDGAISASAVDHATLDQQ